MVYYLMHDLKEALHEGGHIFIASMSLIEMHVGVCVLVN